MHKKLLMGLVAILAISVYPGIVFAQTEDAEQVTEATQLSEDSTFESRKEERAKRITGYKAEARERLNTAQQKIVAGVCNTSQLRLEKVQTSIESTTIKRKEKLDSIVQKLKDLSARLQKASINTTELDGLIATLEQKNSDFITEFAVYQQTIEDTVAIDCENDPQGFKASLEAARTKRAEVRDVSTGIKRFVIDSIKPLLEQIKNTLQQSTLESED